MIRRRAKHISTSFIQDADFDEIFAIVVICDDGTIWRRIEGGRFQAKWENVENIPQMPLRLIQKGRE